MRTKEDEARLLDNWCGTKWEYTEPEPDPPDDAELLQACQGLLQSWRDWAVDVTGAGLPTDRDYRDQIDYLLHYHRDGSVQA